MPIDVSSWERYVETTAESRVEACFSAIPLCVCSTALGSAQGGRTGVNSVRLLG